MPSKQRAQISSKNNKISGLLQPLLLAWVFALLLSAQRCPKPSLCPISTPRYLKFSLLSTLGASLSQVRINIHMAPAHSGTFQPLQHRSGTLRERLHSYTKRTLGAGGSINEAVGLSGGV